VPHHEIRQGVEQAIAERLIEFLPVVLHEIQTNN